MKPNARRCSPDDVNSKHRVRTTPHHIHQLQETLPDPLFPHDVLEELQHLCVATHDQFSSIRSPHHLSRIIHSHASLRQQLRSSANQRVSLHSFRSQLCFTFGHKKVLSVALCLRFLSPDEQFDERHLCQCLQRYPDSPILIPQSFYSYRHGNESTVSYYFELEKKSLATFTDKEIQRLQNDLQREVIYAIERLSTTVALPQNEEETLRTILLLSQQIKRIKDLPHVMIHFREQTDETLVFQVIAVRVIKKGEKETFTLPKVPHLIRIIPMKNATVGTLRGRHHKQALSFLVQCEKLPFIRPNRSIDLLQARQAVVFSLTEAIGKIRDMNRGLFFQQQHILNELRPLLSEEECKELHVVENLFCTITPCIMKNMVSKEQMFTLFRQYLALQKSTLKNKSSRFVAEKHHSEAFVGFFCPEGFIPEELLLIKNFLGIDDHCLGVCHTRFSDHLFGFAICHSADAIVQDRFIEYSRGLIEGRRRDLGPPRALRINLNVQNVSFDPRLCHDDASGSIMKMLYEGLTRSTSDTSVCNAIAERVDVSEEGRVYTFFLRSTHWSDTSPLTANDFIYAWKTALNPDFKNPCCHLLFPIKNARKIKEGVLPAQSLGVRALSERTLTVRLEHPTPEFLLLCSHWIYSPLPQKIDTRNPGWSQASSSPPIANGPYMVATQASGHHLKLIKNPSYWNACGTPTEQMHISLNCHDAQALTAFHHQDIDWVGAPFSKIPLPQTRKAPSACSISVNAIRSIALNTRSPLFRSVKIRQAFSLSLHRKRILQECFHSEEGCSHSLLPKDLSLLEAQMPLAYNMIQAQSDFRSGIQDLGIVVSSLPPLQFLVPDVPEDRAIATKAIEMWKDAFGLHIHLHLISATHFLEIARKTPYDLISTVWHSVCQDSTLAFDPFKSADDKRNLSQWSHDMFSNLLARAEEMAPSENRRHLMREAEQFLLDEMPVIPVCDCAIRFLACSRLSSFHFSPFGTIDFQRIL